MILLCVGILPGVLYLLFASGTHTMSCPQCGMFLGTRADYVWAKALLVLVVGFAAICLLSRLV